MESAVAIPRRLAQAFALLALTVIFLITGPVFGADAEVPFEALPRTIERLVSGGEVVGAQILIGHGDKILIERCLGRVSPERSQPVDAGSMFCIGSTSKPMVATIVMGLVSEGLLELDKPIDYLLPQFGKLRVAGSSEPVPAPTLRQLLMHRGGIYSQERKLTPEQMRLIRDFRRTLEQAVNGITPLRDRFTAASHLPRQSGTRK